MYAKKNAVQKKNIQSSSQKNSSAPAAAGNLPNSAMLSMVNQNEAMEREADRVSSEVGASCDRLDDIKSVLGSRLGVDFSGVKFHTDDAADRAAKSYDAKAFTKGGDVYLGKDGMNPVIAAHELVHTVQQGAVSGGSVMSAPTEQVQLWGRKKATPKAKALVDTKGMNFGKRSYSNDKDYQKLEALMNEYNNSGSSDSKMALMEAAMQYIDSNSRGKEAKHVGRTKNAEKLLMQLSMDDGQKMKGLGNIERMKNQLDTQNNDYGNANRAEGKKVLNTLSNAVEKKGNFSNAMSMIAANVMADQSKSNYNIDGQSGTHRTYGDDNDPDNYNYLVTGRADSTDGCHANNVGTNFHEFTHASVGESYDNTRMFFSADTASSDDDILKLRDERLARMNEIKNSYNGKGLTKSDMDTRYEYATSSKSADKYYLSNLGKRKTQTVDGKKVKSREGGVMNDLIDKSSGQARDKLVKEKEQMQKMVTPFEKEFDNKENKYVEAQNRAQELWGITRGFNTHERYNEYKAAVDEASDISKNLSSHEDTLIEYDSVINQMLMEYEMNSKDRSSQHYRQLKAAALRAHVDRMKAKAKRNQENK